MSAPQNRKKGSGWLAKSPAFIVAAILLMVSLGPMTGSIQKARELECMGSTLQIAEGLGDYAKDHDGAYPTGKSSTEIFQKLLDEGYINDPYEFCWDGWMTDGTRAQYSGKLRPEDVCYDITIPLDSASPAHLPIVFLTGYKVTYSPGGRATPLPIHHEGLQRRLMAVTYQDKTMALLPRYSWLGFGRGDYYPGPPYSFANPQTGELGGQVLFDGTITSFVPTDCDAKGHVYRQLTPEGEISP